MPAPPDSVDPDVRSGPTRKTPVVLLAVAALLLILRVATGIYEAREGRAAPPVNGAIEVRTSP